MSDDSLAYCKRCKSKDPPVDTPLKVGENISEYRFNTGKFYCDDCYKEMQKLYNDTSKGTWAKYLLEKEQIELEEFEEEWNDPEFRNEKELSDKVVSVWNKYKRRKPKSGILRDTACAVIFKDMWNLTVDKVIEDLLDARDDTATIRMRHKEILLLYIPNVIEAFRGYYRRRARNRWEHLITSLNHKYAGREKLVAKPEYKDDKTQLYEKRWFLLSYEEELKIRIEINEAKKQQINHIMDVEGGIVKEYEQREEEIREKEREHKQQGEQEKSDNEKEGGE